MADDLSPYDASGRDDETGVSYSVLVSPSTYFSAGGNKLHFDVKYHLFLPPGEDTVPYNYHRSTRWDLEAPGVHRGLLEADDLGQWLDHTGVPVAARSDTVRLIFDSEWTVVFHELSVRIEMYYVPRDQEDEDEDEEEEFYLRLMPASREAVEGLEKVAVSDAEREASCAVCLEEFSVGYEIATKMPCAHVFHGDCIVRWLENQCVCPLCRFELPCDEE